MNLIPAAVVLTAVAAGWRHPWFGAVVFATLAIGSLGPDGAASRFDPGHRRPAGDHRRALHAQRF